MNDFYCLTGYNKVVKTMYMFDVYANLILTNGLRVIAIPLLMMVQL